MGLVEGRGKNLFIIAASHNFLGRCQTACSIEKSLVPEKEKEAEGLGGKEMEGMRKIICNCH